MFGFMHMPEPDTTLDGFDRFWAAYPRKHARQDAKKAWRKLRPSAALVDIILDHIELRRQSRQWRDGFIPYPATFLRGARWEDELDPRRDFYRAKL